MNLAAIMKIKPELDRFFGRHPKVPAFLASVKEKRVCEGMEIAVAVRYPDGTEYKTGIRLREEDIELAEILKKADIG